MHNIYRFFEEWSLIGFVLVAGTLTAFVQSTLVFGLIYAGVSEKLVTDRLPVGLIVVSSLVVAPFIETYFSQKLPIDVSKRFGCDEYDQIFYSVIVFCGLHGVAYGRLYLLVTIPSGLVFAFTYMMYRNKGRDGFVPTWATHLVHNFWGIAIISLRNNFL
jgi:hypothetical protein